MNYSNSTLAGLGAPSQRTPDEPTRRRLAYLLTRFQRLQQCQPLAIQHNRRVPRRRRVG